MIRLAAREVGLAASLERFRVRKELPIYHFNSDLHIGGDEAEKSLSAKSLSEPWVDEVEIALHPDHYLADGMRHGCA
jgi:hypothetical protein